MDLSLHANEVLARLKRADAEMMRSRRMQILRRMAGTPSLPFEVLQTDIRRTRDVIEHPPRTFQALTYNVFKDKVANAFRPNRASERTQLAFRKLLQCIRQTTADEMTLLIGSGHESMHQGIPVCEILANIYRKDLAGGEENLNIVTEREFRRAGIPLARESTQEFQLAVDFLDEHRCGEKALVIADDTHRIQVQRFAKAHGYRLDAISASAILIYTEQFEAINVKDIQSEYYRTLIKLILMRLDGNKGRVNNLLGKTSAVVDRKERRWYMTRD